MAWAKGTATDFIDFLRKLRDYADGTIDPSVHPTITAGVQVPAPDRWTVLTNGGGMPSIPGSGFATDGEVYLEGPGSDPADEIIIGFKTYRNTGANIFGISIRGFTAFDSGLTFDTLPGVSPDARFALDDASMDCWFWVTARRIMAAARIGTTDILIHAGFIQQFGTRNQYPYPLLVAGSVSDVTQSFQTGNFSHSCMPDPASASAYLRWVDGSWQQYRNYINASDQRAIARSGVAGNCIWPQRNTTTNDEGASGGSFTISEDAIFEQWSGSSLQISNSEISAYPMFPSVLSNGTQLVGRIDGLMTVFGLGLVAGDTLTDSSGSPAIVYDVFKNTWRSEPIDFLVVRRT